MAIEYYPITTTPHSPSHLQVVLDRLQRNIEAVASGGTAGGSTHDGVVNEAVAAGDILYPPSTGGLSKAIATSLATSTVVGVVTKGAVSGGTATLQCTGVVECLTWALTPGTVYYLSALHAGQLTDISPVLHPEVSLRIGIAVAATKLSLLPSPQILL